MPRRRAARQINPAWEESDEDERTLLESEADSDPDFEVQDDGSEYFDSDDEARPKGQDVDDIFEDMIDLSQDTDNDELLREDDSGDIHDVEEQIAQFDLDEGNSFDERDPDVLHDGNVHSAEYYRQSMRTMDTSTFRRKEYAPGTEARIVHAENQWQSFCLKVLQRTDWRQCLRDLRFKAVYHFLHWHLSQRTGKNGKFKRQMKSQSSLTAFWCFFRLAFLRNTHWNIDKQIDKHLIYNSLVKLHRQHQLTHKKRPNRAMTLEDLKLQIEETLRTTKKSFRLGEQRILTGLFLQLLAPAGSRPQSILDMRFGDIQVLLARDPSEPDRNAAPRLVIKFTLEYTKRYLGPKAETTFILPETLFDPSLLLSPHVFLLSILFRHRAFNSEKLNDNPHRLSELRIVGEHKKELLLPLKDNIKTQYIFRQYEKTGLGFALSEKAITQGMMGGWVKFIGKLRGFATNTICYTLRYKAGNDLDKNASQAVRNQCLGHKPNSDVYEINYRSRDVRVDVLAIQKGQAQDHAFLEQLASHGSSIDPRRPTELSHAQNEALKQDSLYQRLQQELKGLGRKKRREDPEITERREALGKRVKNLWQKLREEELTRVREAWTAGQAVEDIERQLEGQDVAPEPTAEVRTNGPQQRMLDALRAPLEHDLEAQFQRRTKAINALVAYCQVEEPLSMSNRMMGDLMVGGVDVSKVDVLQRPRKVEPPRPRDPLEVARELRDSVYGAVGQVRRCFVCVANAMTLPPDDPMLPSLVWVYATHSSLGRHFERVHLKSVDPNAKGECPMCSPPVRLHNKMHLQNHAQLVHGTKTKSAEIQRREAERKAKKIKAKKVAA